MNKVKFAQLESGEGYQNTRDTKILNPYVNFYGYDGDHVLQDTLVSESIQMRGVKCFYIRRDMANLDTLFGEDVNSKFNRSWEISVYIKTYDSYEGQRDFFSKFGMQVEDELTFQTNPNLFRDQVDGERPKEGDLIYFPMANVLFEIIWCENETPLYQVGKNALIDIIARRFVYSGEDIKPKVYPRNNSGENELNINELTNFDDEDGFYSDELEAVYNLDGLTDINTEQGKEVAQIENEGGEFIEGYSVINGKGRDPRNPFS